MTMAAFKIDAGNEVKWSRPVNLEESLVFTVNLLITEEIKVL